MVKIETIESLLKDLGLQKNADGWLFDSKIKMPGGKLIFNEEKAFKVVHDPLAGFNEDGVSKLLDKTLKSLGWYFEVFSDGVYVLAAIESAEAL